MSDLAKDMIAYRAKHKLSMVALAKLCGVSSQTVYNLENGYSEPTRRTVAAIEEVIYNDESVPKQS